MSGDELIRLAWSRRQPDQIKMQSSHQRSRIGGLRRPEASVGESEVVPTPALRSGVYQVFGLKGEQRVVVFAWMLGNGFRRMAKVDHKRRSHVTFFNIFNKGIAVIVEHLPCPFAYNGAGSISRFHRMVCR